MEWDERVEGWIRKYHIRTRRSVELPQIRTTLSSLRSANQDLEALYLVTNGLSLEWFEIFPIRDARDPKHTWQDIVRVNDAESTLFLGKCVELLDRFMVIGSVGAGKAAAIDRGDNSIWYEEGEELSQIHLPLVEFIETCLREVTEP